MAKRAKKRGKGAAKVEAPPAHPSFIISNEGEVCQVGPEEIWREDFTHEIDNSYCKGCLLRGECVITKIAAVALCDRRTRQ